MATTIYLMTHGATVANLCHPARLQSRKQNPPLTSSGIVWARDIADELIGQPPSACFCSPANRTIETARIVGHAWGLHPTLMDDLQECDLGTWDGLDWQAIRYFDAFNYHRFIRDPFGAGCPGGENLSSVRDRVRRAMNEIFGSTEGRASIVVSHPLSVRVYLNGDHGVDFDPRACLEEIERDAFVLRREGSWTSLDRIRLAVAEERRAA